MIRLDAVADIRIGMVATRKKVKKDSTDGLPYKMLNLRCIGSGGSLDLIYTESFLSSAELKPDFLTQKGDVLFRLSAPYTAAIIQEDVECGYLVPAHFAIIRTDRTKLLPEYLLWILRSPDTIQTIRQNCSGSTAFGTISSGFLGALEIPDIPIAHQRVIGQYLLLSEKEQELYFKLATLKELYHREKLNAIYDLYRRNEKK